MAALTDIVLGPLTLIGYCWLLTALAPALLGMRIGLPRAALAALVGLSAGGVFVGIIPPAGVHNAHTGLAFLSLVCALTLLSSLTLLVVVELLLPRGAVGSPLAMLRATRRRLARIGRYLHLGSIFLRHQLGGVLLIDRASPAAAARFGRSLRLALEEAGVVFIKLGQVLSTRPDLLPCPIVNELSSLQTQVPAAPWPSIARVLAEELGAPIDAVFAEFDPEPLAAASIAQVHLARLHDGSEVVVKVRRPDIAPIVDRDLDIIGRWARRWQRRGGLLHDIGVADLAEGFAAALREELDSRIEARNLTAIAAAMPEAPAPIIVPGVHPERSSARVLVLDRLDGMPLGSAGPALAARGLPQRELARALLDTVLRQITVAGVFHADPHPGNVLLLADDRLGLLDFGCVGRLDATMRQRIARLLVAVDSGDPQRLCAALLTVVDAPQGLDRARLLRAVTAFVRRHLCPGAEPGVALFTDLFALLASNKLSAPPALGAVFRAMTTLDGTLRQLSPGFDLIGEARRFATDQLLAGMLPASMARSAVRQLRVLAPILADLPASLDRITAAFEAPTPVPERVRPKDTVHRFSAGAVQQLLLGMIGGSAGITAALLLGIHGGPMVTASTSLFQVLGYHLLVVASGIGLRMLLGATRRPART